MKYSWGRRLGAGESKESSGQAVEMTGQKGKVKVRLRKEMPGRQ